MKEEFLNTIPTDTHESVDTRKLVKNIKSLYRAKGTDKAHKAFFKLLFNEPSEVYKPTEDMLRLSGGNWGTQNFIRCTQTAEQALNDTIELVGQTITQANDPADDNVNLATAIVENITKFREGTVEIIEVEINSETTTGTFVTGKTLTGISNINEEVTVSLTTSSAVANTTISNDGSTLTVGDEATLTGGAGAGARVQVQDISGSGVSEVIVDAVGTGYEEGDTITFSSGTAEAKVSIVNGGFIPESGTVDIHVELEIGTVTGGGSGDLLLETYGDGTEGKFLDSTSLEFDTEVRIELENETGHMLTELGGENNAIAYILNQTSEPNKPISLEATDRIGLESKTTGADGITGSAIVQENSTGAGDITDIRMIASGSGYTTLPTATVPSGRRFLGLQDATQLFERYSQIELEDIDYEDTVLETGGNIVLEDGSGVFHQEADVTAEQSFVEFEAFLSGGNILNEDESIINSAEFGDGTGAGRISFEDGGRVLNETFDGASATIIPFGDEIGRATSLNIIEHGINYTSAPSFAFPHYAVLKTVSGTISADETFTSDVSGATGTVIDFTAPLLKYTATTSSFEIGETVTFSGGETAVVIKSDPLTGTGTIATNITTAGKYINQDGHISEGSKKIQDSLYYQDYSYVIKVSESINKWRDSLKRAVHPSGFYVTGEVNIATRLSAQIRQPVGATLASGLFTGTSDSPIYMRLNTLFSTVFGRRTGVALSSSFGGTQLDQLTKRTRAVANAGYSPQVSTAFTSSHYAARGADVNLTPETTLELEQRNRNSFYDLRPVIIQDNLIYESATSADQIELENEVGNLVVNFRNEGYTVRDVEVRNGFAYGGPRVKNLSDRAFTTFSANNAITLEGGAGDGEIILENESGVLQHPQSDSWSTTIKDWNTLRFSGTLNSNVDGETMRLSDINGTKSSQNHRINFAFPTEVTKSA